jgi:GT2 family glycosyltransferase
LDYSIIIPVFNKAGLTRQCLQTIRPTLDGAGDGEIIVVDNASSDETPEMLREFPWVRVIRNEQNRGFAGANNQGAAAARGDFLVLLNNDIVAHPGWLASMINVAKGPRVGAVGARLLFPDGTIQHAGVRFDQVRVGTAGFVAIHDMYRYPGDYPEACGLFDLQAVTGACLLTPRAVYQRLGGLDEAFWNGYEDVDYCLRVRADDLRVVYDGEASLTHFESQSGGERFRKVSWNVLRLAERWNGQVEYDAQRVSIQRGLVRRVARVAPGVEGLDHAPIPRTTIVCYGDGADRHALDMMLRANRAPIERIFYVPPSEAIAAGRAAMEIRADRYLTFVDSRSALGPGWLDSLIADAEFSRNCAAATYAPPLPVEQNIQAFTADARCTLLRVSKFPQHLRLRDFPTLSGSVADLLIRALELRVGTRGSSVRLGDLPALDADEQFEHEHRMPIDAAVTAGGPMIEAALRKEPRRRVGMASIVMLSWNAPKYTQIALQSIQQHTRGEYEIIIVDNGSGPETVNWLRTLSDPRIRVLYNATNRGFAGGNNQGMAAAQGEYIVLLNNDVVVTEGWLDGLLGAFDRIPGLGISAPRSNKIAGDQIVADATYRDIEEMHAYAKTRRGRFLDEGYLTDRAIGFCLCIDRRVIDEVGGIDERFGVGNFEDDDFCLRVRAAGYQIFVCDDVFIHHFGSQTFAANSVDWTATMRSNWRIFAQKWGYPETYPENGYATTPAIAQGYDRARHYVSLPRSDQDRRDLRRVEVAFRARVSHERDWNEIGAFTRRYLQAFTANEPTLLSITVSGEVAAGEVGRRVEKLLARSGIDPALAADVEIVEDEADTAAVLAVRTIDVVELDAKNPSALRRLLRETAG